MVRLIDLPEYERDHLIGKNLSPLGPECWTKPDKPVEEMRVALITTAGLHFRDEEAFDFTDATFRPIPSDEDADNLKRLGIKASIRRVENNILINRLRKYDYDMFMRKYYQFKIPVPLLMRSYFLSQYVDVQNMWNYAGVNNPAVDFLVGDIAGNGARRHTDCCTVDDAIRIAVDRVAQHLSDFVDAPRGLGAGQGR